MTLNYKANLFDFKKSGIYIISCLKKEKNYRKTETGSN